MVSKGRLSRIPLDGWIVLVLAALAVGAFLRLWDLSGPSLSHPEIYIPGIDLIPGLSTPPPRHALLETLSWQFHQEPHPVGYYIAMLAWTSVAGTSEFALRLPAAILGIGTIWLVWRLGCRVFGRDVGAISAALLAINGFHIFWSQAARMYAAGSFFAVLSTLALVSCLRSDKPRPGIEAIYVLSLVAGTQSVELFWAIPFLHLAFVAIAAPAPGGVGSRDTWKPWKPAVQRMSQLPAIAIALASPEFVHAALLARHGAAPDPVPQFLLDYFSYGFLFESGDAAGAFAAPSTIGAAIIALSAIALAIMGAGRRSATVEQSGAQRPLPFSIVALASLTGVVLIVFLASISERHRGALTVFAVVPLLCAGLPVLASMTRSTLMRAAGPVIRLLDRIAPLSLLLLMLAMVPPLVFYAASAKMSVLAPRAFLAFTPFLIILVAAGLMQLGRLPILRIAGLTGVGLLFAASCVFAHDRPHSPRDYKQIAAIITREARPDDVVMIRSQNWADTPIFYYLAHAHYVTEQGVSAIGPGYPPRLWMMLWDWDPRPYGLGALARSGYVEVNSRQVLGGQVILFTHKAASGARQAGG